ncbi:hypothetical protein EKE94_00950 [Mesobaculum littorinae]|uniref:Uncharacterized protein n=1 Tax=Mesobaculum littorinae TaxID=2486419 RepID=A0A438AL44_9RHOB|nr:hypothetical protein [Mesobaculum littorinae]RVV99297.1 hypothetical protein EKE94_00950 [Mesobaculum littorinae]
MLTRDADVLYRINGVRAADRGAEAGRTGSGRDLRASPAAPQSLLPPDPDPPTGPPPTFDRSILEQLRIDSQRRMREPLDVAREEDLGKDEDRTDRARDAPGAATAPSLADPTAEDGPETGFAPVPYAEVPYAEGRMGIQGFLAPDKAPPAVDLRS